MKFSLISMLTVTAFIAWVLALNQMSADMRRIFIPMSFLSVIAALFLVAMITPRDSTGQIDYENSELLDALEPTFKLSFVIALLCVAGFLFALCYALSYALL